MADMLPLFPLGAVLFPGMLMPLHVFEDRYRRLLAEREGADPMFGIALTSHGREVGDRPDIHDVGTAATLVAAGRYPDGRYDVIVRGGRRFRVRKGTEDWSHGYLVAEIDWLPEHLGASTEEDELADLAAQTATVFERFIVAFEQATAANLPREPLPDAPAEVAWAVCSRVPLDTWERQRLLEHPTTRDRLVDLAAILRRERDLLVTTGVGGAAVVRPGGTFTPN